MPHQLKAYRGAFGNKDERRVGKWLTSTLLWLPFLIPALALGLGTLPYPKGASTFYLIESACIFAFWILSGLTPPRRWWGAFGLIIVLFGLLGSLGSLLTVEYGIGASKAPNLLIFTVLAAFIFSPIVAETMQRDPDNDQHDFSEPNGYAMFTAGGLAWLDKPSAMYRAAKVGQPSWLVRSSLIVLFLNYAYTIWISFLAGGRLMQSNGVMPLLNWVLFPISILTVWQKQATVQVLK
jgi:hypothetical protein